MSRTFPDEPKRRSMDEVVAAYCARFGSMPDVVTRAPGRVNLLGAHVDYSEGWVMPAAIDRAIWAAAADNGTDHLVVEALDLAAHRSVPVRPPAPPIAAEARTIDWVDYPRGVAWSLRESGHAVGGMNAVFGGDLPVGAGVSSSAAVEMAFLYAWRELGDLELTSVEAAQIGVTTENEYLGLQSGIMDQFASVHGREQHVLCIDCRDLGHEAIPVAADLVIVVTDTGVRRRLVDSQFNDRRAECEAAVAKLGTDGLKLRTLRDVPETALAELASLPEPLDRRARHVVEECARVRRGARALRAGDLGAFADCVRASHISSRELYDVSIPELDLLAETAWEVPGCHGARLTGAGFGGCVTALAERSAVEELRRRQDDAFRRKFGRRPVSFVSSVAAGASVERC